MRIEAGVLKSKLLLQKWF